jgi:quinol monooxygenase YgiN
MTPFTILAEFRIKAGAFETFKRLVMDNAARSLAIESGCRTFDVLKPSAESDRILLYEVYDDESAFQAHSRTSHFLEFDALSKHLIIGKKITLVTHLTADSVET